MIADSVAFLVARGQARGLRRRALLRRAARDDPAYALRCLRAAAEARAPRTSTLCDTNGASLPARDRRGRDARSSARSDVAIGIHCHNDAECGVANSLAAVAAGARWSRGRSTATASAAATPTSSRSSPTSSSSSGHECLPSLEGLTEAAHYVDELLNFVPDPDQPYVGKNAFAHKGGMHVAGVNADPATFEHIDPAAVGNCRELLISELSGKGTVLQRAADGGIELDEAAAARVVERVKELEHRGFQFEAADGSFDLLIRRETGDYEPLFRLESWRVIAEKREDGRVADRGHDQDLGRRRALSCAPPRATARSTRSTARCAPRSARATRTCATSSSSTTRSASSTSGRRPAR